MRRIAFMNQKGGVAKTTTVANLGAAFADLGRRVLVVDMDPQANLTTHLDDGLPDDGPTIYEVLTGRARVEDAVLQTAAKNLWILPSSIDLSGAEIELVQEMGREKILKGALEEYLENLPPERTYEFVLVDCPPSLGLLSLNALTSVREVMIPIQTQFFALRGMSKLLDVIELVRRRLNPDLELTAIIPSIADLRTNLTAEVVQEIRSYFGNRVTRTIIRTNVRLAEAPSYGKSILQYDRSCRGAKDFLRLAREFLGRLPESEDDIDPGRPVQFDDLPPALPEAGSETPASEKPERENRGAETPGTEAPGTGEAASS